MYVSPVFETISGACLPPCKNGPQGMFLGVVSLGISAPAPQDPPHLRTVTSPEPYSSIVGPLLSAAVPSRHSPDLESHGYDFWKKRSLEGGALLAPGGSWPRWNRGEGGSEGIFRLEESFSLREREKLGTTSTPPPDS
jgi:hypothetical protein